MKALLIRTMMPRLLLALLLLMAAVPCSWAVADAVRIVDSPLPVPELLLRKFDTTRLPAQAGSGVIRYTAQADAELLRQWLRSESYLDAKIEVSVDENGALWQVVAGQPWHVRRVEVLPAPIVEKLDLIKSGALFRSEDYEAAKARLLWSWRDAGFLKAGFAEAVVKPDRTTHQVDIVWHVQTGPLYTISEIRVEGDKQYDAKLPLKLSRLKAGQVASQQRLRDAMRYIGEDSRYQHAMVVPDVEQAEAGRVPVRITVSETAWRKLTGDIGYSTDSGFTLGAAWVDRSLFKGLLETQLRAQVSRTNSGAGATLLRPVWPAANQQVGVSLDYNRVDSDGRRYNAISGGPFWQWNFKGDDYFRLTLHGEQVRESGLSLVTLGPRADLHFARSRGGLLPTRGWRADLGLDLPMRMGSPGLWPYIDISSRYYYQPWSWLLVSPRAGYGRTLNLQGTVPKTYRQFAGGSASARGYALDSLGPTGVDGLATGGLMKAYGGVDLVLMPDAEYVSPVLFSDVARLWQAVGTKPAIAWSVGAGLIVHTPAGPLRIDVALPQKKRPQDSSFQLYISLGEVL